MMGRLRNDQGFYSFCLEEVVPDDHLVREIAAVLDLSWVHAELAAYYSRLGRPSIDPVLMIRLLIEPSRYIFQTERGGPMTRAGFRFMIERTGIAAKLPFPVHPHMLRHSCGYKLGNDGRDTRAIQHYLGHRHLGHVTRYTELSPRRFDNFWED